MTYLSKPSIFFFSERSLQIKIFCNGIFFSELFPNRGDTKIGNFMIFHFLDLRWLKTVSSTEIVMGRFCHSLSLNATIMVSKDCLIISEQVVIILVTQYVTTATG